MKLGEILVKDGLATSSHIQRALAAQQKSGGRLGSLLISAGMVTADGVARALAKQKGVPAALEKHLGARDVNVGRLLPREVATRLFALPVARSRDGAIVVCVRDPGDEVMAELTNVLGAKVILSVACEAVLRRYLAQAYPSTDDEFEVDLESKVHVQFAPGEGAEAARVEAADKKRAKPQTRRKGNTRAPKGRNTKKPRVDNDEVLDLGQLQLVSLDDVGVDRIGESTSVPKAAETLSGLSQAGGGAKPAVSDTASGAKLAASASASSTSRLAIPLPAATAAPASASGSASASPSVDGAAAANSANRLGQVASVPAVAAASAPVVERVASASTPPASTVSASPPSASTPSASTPSASTPSASTPSASTPPAQASSPSRAVASAIAPAPVAAPAGEIDEGWGDAPPEPTPPKSTAPTPQSAIGEIELATHRDRVGDVVIACAGGFADSLLLVIRDGVAMGHRGMGKEISPAMVSMISVPLAQASTLRTTAERGESYIGPMPIAGGAVQDRFLRLFGSSKCLIVEPIALSGRVIALWVAATNELAAAQGAAIAVRPVLAACATAYARIIRESKQAAMRQASAS